MRNESDFFFVMKCLVVIYLQLDIAITADLPKRLFYRSLAWFLRVLGTYL